MSDSQTHRGRHPKDGALFAPDQAPVLKTAVVEFCWLLTRGYAEASALKIVGDRHALRERQRMLVARASCSDSQRAHRLATRTMNLSGKDIYIDGFNLLITVEAALSAGLIFRGRDGALRDLASVHGSYRTVEETDAALKMIGQCLARHQPNSVTWIFDQPVSNSGRLAQRVRALAEARQWPWEVRLEMNPDRELIALTSGLIASSDALILDHVGEWLPLAEIVIQSMRMPVEILDFTE